MQADQNTVFIVGSSGHARVIIDSIEKEGRFQVAGLLDPFRQADEIAAGFRILGGQRDLPALSRKTGVWRVIIAIGDNWDRRAVYEEIRTRAPHIKFVGTRHPFSELGKGVDIGTGTAVMPGAVINCHTRVGRFCIVNTAASVDHDCVLDEFVSIAPGATLGGNVRIGECTAVSLGARIAQKVSIGRHVLIGAGAVVLDDLPDNVVAYGVPAKVIRERTAGEKYL